MGHKILTYFTWPHTERGRLQLQTKAGLLFPNHTRATFYICIDIRGGTKIDS
jgi:hypothetical protein